MCHCTPNKRTPVCESCPETAKQQWGYIGKPKMQDEYGNKWCMPCQDYLPIGHLHKDSPQRMTKEDLQYEHESKVQAPIEDVCSTFGQVNKETIFNGYCRFCVDHIQLGRHLKGECPYRPSDSTYDDKEAKLDLENDVYTRHWLILKMEKMNKEIGFLTEYIRQAKDYRHIMERLDRLEGYMEMEDRVTASDVLNRLTKLEKEKDSITRKIPHKCPVCGGLPVTDNIRSQVMGGGKPWDVCQPCDGKGIVWG